MSEKMQKKKKMPLPYVLIIIIFLAIFVVVAASLDLMIKTVLLFSLIVLQLVIAFIHSRSDKD